MVRGSSDCCNSLGRMIEDGFWMDLEPGLPGSTCVPPRAPDGIIKADHKQVDMVRGSSDCCNLWVV